MGKEKETALPKNIRQIGEIRGAEKICIEDYVMTCIHKKEPQEKDGYLGIFYGEQRKEEDGIYLFLRGILEIPDGEEEAVKKELEEQKEKYFPDCIFYAEFDRWNYSGIYLAASVKRSACTLGKNTYIFRDLRVDGNDHSGVLATDWIYDDHLHFRHSEYSRRADRSGED